VPEVAIQSLASERLKSTRRRILRKRAARSCCSRPPRQFIRSTTRTRRRSAFFTLPAESGRPHRAADEQKPESALRTSIGRTLVRVDRRRKPPSSRSARGPDRAEPNVRTDVSRADLRVAFESICDQAACPRLVRLPINSEHYARLSRLWRRDLFLLLGRRACRRDHGNAKKCCNSNAERNHDRSSPLARQPQRASIESFAFASLMVIATLRCAVTGATRACA
jgi:hypothetical protein